MISISYESYKVKTVQKLKNGYGYRIILKYGDNSSRTQQKAGFSTIKEAEEDRCITIADLTKRKYLVNGNIPASEYFEFWVEEVFRPRANKYSSYDNYARIVKNHIIPFFRNKRMSVINTADIIRLYKNVYDYSPSVAQNVRAVIKTSLEDAITYKAVVTNVARDVKLPKDKNGKCHQRNIDSSNTFNHEQVMRLIEGSANTPIHMMVLFNVVMGLRCSEIIGLKYSDVDFIHQTLKVERQLGIDINKPKETVASKTYTKQEITPKSHSSVRTLDIPDIVFDAILKEKKRYDANKRRRSTTFQDYGYICCSTYGRPRSKGYHLKHYKALLEQLGLPDIRWHDLRATASTTLLKAGFTPKSVANMMGHSKEIITVDVYGDKKKLAAEKLEKLENFIGEVVPKEATIINVERCIIDTKEYLVV